MGTPNKLDGRAKRGIRGMFKRGASLKEISDKYDISTATIYYHVDAKERAKLRNEGARSKRH